MSVPSEIGKTAPVEDKYKGQSTADALLDDTEAPIKEEIDLVEDEPKEEETEDLLKDKEDKPKKEVKEKDEDKEEDEKIELEEDEEPVEGEEPVFPVPAKVITAKYPNLFKDFPHLKVAMFRDKQYTEMFGTVDDAKEALDSRERLSSIQTDIFNGNIKDLLGEVRSTDQNAFNKLVDNYLPALKEADQTAWATVICNVVKDITRDMYGSAKNLNNQELEDAAIVLHQYILGPGAAYTPPQKLAKEEPPKDENIERQKEALAQQQFSGVLGHITTRIENTLKATVNEHIDPKGQMSYYEKKNAVQEVLNDIYGQIEKDSYFRPYYDKLWAKAAQNGFRNSQDIEGIEKAYKARARTMLRDSITRVRNEALKDSGKKASDDGKDRKGPIRPGRTASGGSNKSSSMSVSEKAKAIPKNMSTLDYLNSDD